MEWDTDLNKVKEQGQAFAPEFRRLGNSLLQAYLLVTLGIFLLSGFIVYQFFARSLYQQLDRRLLNLAEAASHSLNAIRQNPQTFRHPTKHLIDYDGDLDIPWQNLQQAQQSIEWLNSQGQRLAHSGDFIVSAPLQTGFQNLKNNTIRSLTISVCESRQNCEQGYIRVTETTQTVETTLAQLKWGLGLGGMMALGLMSWGGIWLTGKSLKPMAKSFQQLKQFTADASHELRGPLTAIQTSVAVMQSHPERIHPLDREKLAGIASATKQMTRLVEDLLLLARNDARPGPAFCQDSPIPLVELLEDVLEQNELPAQARQISLILEGKASIAVKGNGSHLLRLFNNLVENAWQYTPVGGKVVVALASTDGKALVTVTDTGVGIASQHLPLIFDRFWRADTARSYREEGSGLGLSIVQAIAWEHGGGVSVESTPGKGTCFTVILPLANSSK